MRHQRAEAAWSSGRGAGGDVKQGLRVDAGVGEVGEVLGQLWDESVVAGRRDQGAHEAGPVGQGRGVAGAQAGVQVVLPEGVGLGGLCGSGGAMVAVGDGLCGSPDGEVADQIRGGHRSTS